MAALRPGDHTPEIQALEEFAGTLRHLPLADRRARMEGMYWSNARRNELPDLRQGRCGIVCEPRRSQLAPPLRKSAGRLTPIWTYFELMRISA